LSLTLPFSALRQRILQLITHHPQATYEEMALNFGKDRTTIMRNIAKLKKGGILRRIGSKKTGYWKIETKARDEEKGV
jgi:ATP-dependent DNA helicase RecG